MEDQWEDFLLCRGGAGSAPLCCSRSTLYILLIDLFIACLFPLESGFQGARYFCLFYLLLDQHQWLEYRLSGTQSCLVNTCKVNEWMDSWRIRCSV